MPRSLRLLRVCVTNGVWPIAESKQRGMQVNRIYAVRSCGVEFTFPGPARPRTGYWYIHVNREYSGRIYVFVIQN